MAHHKRRRPKHQRAGCTCNGKVFKDERWPKRLPLRDHRRVIQGRPEQERADIDQKSGGLSDDQP